ncbi:sel1 repeat family protein [Oxalobacter sp. OttesenSCG-928-P03]|nr:sel1 repeat family protein [Oxalobacter sp. OttesenSCG-928-P03]
MKRFSVMAGLGLLLCALQLPAAAAGNASCDAILSGSMKRASVMDRSACGIIAKADAGDKEAQYEAGLIYLWGVDSLNANADVAAGWFMKAAEAGQPEAAYRLAALYVNGYGVRQNMERAHEWFEKAAEAGLGMAMFELGGMYEYGLGVKKDEEKARQWYEKARNQHNHDAERTPVLKERELAENPWEKAEAGDALAQYYAGAAKWREALSAVNPVNAQVAYGQSAQWFEKSAAQGFAPAQTQLGMAWTRGTIGKADDETAAIWFARAAEQGDAEAQFQLAILYANGLGVKKDEIRAVGLFTWAAEHEHSEAQRLLAAMYETGMGVKADRAEARKWHRRSAQESNVALRDMLRLTDQP